MDTLKLARSQVIGDTPVRVVFSDQYDTAYGVVTLPAKVWVAFSKILSLGVAHNNLSESPYLLKIEVVGYISKSGDPVKDAEAVVEDQVIRTIRTIREVESDDKGNSN